METKSEEEFVVCTQKRLDNHLKGSTKTSKFSFSSLSIRMENLQVIVPEVLSKAANSMEQHLLCNVKSFVTNQEISHLHTNIPYRILSIQPTDLALGRSAHPLPVSVRCTLTLAFSIWVLHSHNRYEI